MAAALFHLPTSRVIDTNGIADGSTLTFYDTGTDTKRAVYTTSALDVEHPNPLTVAAGAAVPDIYLDDAYTYRLVVKNGAGVTIDDVDPYTGTSATGFFFNQAGSGATQRTGQAKLRETVSVLDFGAVGDGSTDDTTAITNALATGKNVLFPDGYTFITQGLHQVTTNNQRITINGTVKYDGVRRFIATGVYGFQGLFQVQDQVEGVTFDGSGIMDGNWRRAGTTVDQPLEFRDAGSGIYGYRAIGLKVSGITFQHFSENGIKAMNCPALVVAPSCTFYDICNIGVEMYSYANDPRTAVAWVGTVYPPSGSVDGFFDWIDDGEFFANFGNGVGVSFQSAPSAMPVRNLRVGGQYRDCLASIWSENNSAEAINIVIDRPRIEGNYRGAGTASSLSGIGLIGVKNSQVVSPVIYNVGNVTPASGSQSAGLHIVECEGVEIINPIVIDDTGAADRTQFGIRINAGSGVTVKGGKISGVSDTAITKVNSPTDVRIENVTGAEPDETWGNLVKFTFGAQNVGASSTVKMLVSGEAGAEAAVVPCAGRVVAVSVRASDGQVFPATAGNYFWTRINGVEETNLRITGAGATGTQADYATVDGSSQGIAKRAADDAVQCAAGDRLSVLVTTDGSWTAGHDAYADVWFDLGLKL